jgi:hypothetical protein
VSSVTPLGSPREQPRGYETSQDLTPSTRKENGGLVVTFLLWISANRPELFVPAWVADVAREAEEPLVGGTLTQRHRSVLMARVTSVDATQPPLHFERVTTDVVDDWLAPLDAPQDYKRRRALRFFFCDYGVPLPKGWKDALKKAGDLKREAERDNPGKKKVKREKKPRAEDDDEDEDDEEDSEGAAQVSSRGGRRSLMEGKRRKRSLAVEIDEADADAAVGANGWTRSEDERLIDVLRQCW